MLPKPSLVLSREAARVALERVGAAVLYQFWFVIGCVVAVAALVHARARNVTKHVFLQVAFVPRNVRALAAVEGPLALVRHQVRIQRSPISGCISALWARHVSLR